MENYIKEIQVNKSTNAVTAISNCNKIVTWLSSVITEIEEASGVVSITKTDGTTINIPIEQGVSMSDVNDKLKPYATTLEVKDMIESVKLMMDDFMTDDRFRMIMDINSGSCGGDCGGGCGGGCCGFNTCCLNFLTALVDNRDCCGGITIIDNMGNQTNILEHLNVYDIVETSTGTFHVTKCDDEFDIVVGDKVTDNGDGTYTVNPGDDRPNFTIDGNHTTVVDNDDGTYTFCNYDGADCFTLNLDILPTLSKWLIYDGVDKAPWYPVHESEGGVSVNAIPVPGYNFLAFQTIDIIWTDVGDGGLLTKFQQNQFVHNGRMISHLPNTSCVDTVGSYGYKGVYPYAYNLGNDYRIAGKTIVENILDDVGLGYVLVSGGVPITDITKMTKAVDNLNAKQRQLLFKTADTEVNQTYHIWSNMDKYGYDFHKTTAGLLSAYLNTDDVNTIDAIKLEMRRLVTKMGGVDHE